MAYEVVKTIRGHRYRYNVESYRDPESGKVRNKWTYVGRAEGERADIRPNRRQTADEARDRIARAFLKIVETRAWDRVTCAAIARQAKIAEATFYRYFRNREAVLEYCTLRINALLDERLRELQDIAPDAKSERARLRAWAIDLVRRPPGPPALFRLWAAVGAGRVRKERYDLRIRAFAAYLQVLVDRAYIAAPQNLHRAAVALALFQQMITRRSVVEHELLSEEEFAAAGDTMERLVFF